MAKAKNIYRGGGGNDPNLGGTCQYCGDEYNAHFPHHLRNECSVIGG